MASSEIDKLKQQFQLQPHPESCAFIEVWKGDRKVKFEEQTKHSGARATGTSIYTLLTAPNFISWHRHLSDEVYYWHAGGTMKVHLIDKNGKHLSQLMGDALKNLDCAYQCVIPHDTWFAAELVDDADYCFFSAAVVPGFEFEDWFPGKREELSKMFPQHKDLLQRLTKE